MNYILGGGGFVSRIFSEVRVHQGLAYDVGSYFDPRLGFGPYTFSVQTKCASADTAVKSILSEMRRIQREPVSDQELEDAKAFYRGSYPFRFETNSQIASQVLVAELYGLPLDYAARDLEQINKLSKADILKAAQKLLQPEHFIITMTTDTVLTKIDIPGVTIEKK
jgi:zinc protease